MADNVTVDNAALTDIDVATDKVTYSGDADRDLQLMKPVHVAGSEGSKTVEAITQTLGSAKPAAAVLIGGNDGTNIQGIKVGTDGVQQYAGSFKTVSADVTRVGGGDTNIYAPNDALSDSTSAPTAGGFTFTDCARVSGGSGIITDMIVVAQQDAATPIQGEVFIFDTAPTAINDNTPFTVTDAEAKTIVAKIPFACEDIGANQFYHTTNLGIGFTTVGSANLRFLIRVKNTYTPASAEVFTFRLKIMRID